MSQKQHKLSLPAQMVIGLVLGIIVGSISTPDFTAAYLQPFGQLFITLIRMVVVPLVLATIIAGAAGIHDLSKLGRVATKTLIYYFLTTGLAVLIGLIVANLLEPGAGVNLSTEGLKAKEVTAPNLIQTLLNIVPLNPVDALAKGNMLQVIFFAVVFGFALSSLGEAGKPLLKVFELIGDVMIRVTNMVMMYAPIGVFGLMAFTVSKHGINVLLPLGKLILVMTIATALHIIICYLPLVRGVIGMPLSRFVKGVFAPWLIAFTTCSSAAALPTNLQSVRRLGASKSVASFSIPLGNTINMDGTAIYMGVAAVFAAEVYGIPLSLADQLTIMLMGLLASIGTAGVPGAGLIMISIVFTQVHIPLEAIALIAGIDRALDMVRTSTNVLGDATGALLVSRLEGDLNTEPFEEENSELRTGTETFE
ncbi:MAG TPA: dicarboxylate/amino acid:cation symporter [Candidatus Bilophila faecipullorum]|uniref:Dicarboxylate/amino acid:cation symporter n=1 Tax=Candidatus Bilophila faecipullorum TaxID=2838482 RepID=A0A9D1U958_9BACT|nr:dicarboxylate/amino acid:cation symporter [uncultured Bilophila sp.]HIW77835.1 dicarboxylate/amino acid:cation symporter [Candidatus Bilophila faecipullorum]